MNDRLESSRVLNFGDARFLTRLLGSILVGSFLLLVIRKMVFHSSALVCVGVLGVCFGVSLWILLKRSSFQFKLFDISPRHLALVRIVVGSSLLYSSVGAHLQSTLLVPEAYFYPSFPWNVINASIIDPRNPSVLLILQWGTSISLLGVIAGCFTRFSLCLAAVGFTFLYSLQISYTHFFHSGLIPLQMLYILCFSKCQEALSVDSLFRASEKPVSGTSRSSTFFACSMVYVLSYYFCALSKWKSRPFWADAKNVKSQLLSDSLSLLHPLGDLDAMLNFVAWNPPDWVFSMLGLFTLFVELAPILMVFGIWALRLVPLLLACFHLGIFVFNKFLFLDLILLPLIFLPFWTRSAYRGKDSPSRVGPRFPDVLLPAIAITVLACGWILRLEQFPLFTQWAMYSGFMYEAQYVQMYATSADGRRFKTDLSKAIGFLGDARWLDLVHKPAPNNDEQKERLNRVLDKFMEVYNSRAGPTERIHRVELEYRTCHPSIEGIKESRLIDRWIRSLESGSPTGEIPYKPIANPT
jgi:hypothetical protein